MNNIKLENYRHIHFVGVGGISMYLLALYCKQVGMEVSGSDIHESKYTKICKSNGIVVHIGHKRRNINSADIVVSTGAVNNSNIEIVEATSRGIKVIDRAELLAIICKKFKYVIGVAGTHGKTTTCAMIYHILKESGKKVSCHIGADIEHARLNPEDEYLVLECCEYNRSFLRLYYNVAVVLNIDNDHLDCYQNMYNLRNAYKTFLKRAETRFVFDNESTKCIKVKSNKIAKSRVLASNKFTHNNKKFVLDNVYGEHNINNATVAIDVCSYFGISYTKIFKALKTFKAAGRRCQVLGKFNDCDIITDYAHHPSEIRCVYESLKERYKQIYLVLQPHTYSRTKILLKDFVRVLEQVENLVIFKEYSARESKSQGISARGLSEYLDKSIYIKNYNQIKKWLLNTRFAEKACIVFMGAGDINQIAERVVNDLGRK